MLTELLNKVSELGTPLLLGSITTVTITLSSLVFAIIIGLLLALIRLLKIKVVNALISTYVEIFRNTPVLAQLFILYFGLPYMGIKISPF